MLLFTVNTQRTCVRKTQLSLTKYVHVRVLPPDKKVLGTQGKMLPPPVPSEKIAPPTANKVSGKMVLRPSEKMVPLNHQKWL